MKVKNSTMFNIYLTFPPSLPEPWMQEEIRAYYRGKKRLAEMMGKDPERFTDRDVKVIADWFTMRQ